MTIRVFIRRRVRQEARGELSNMLVRARTNAMGKQGYISSETLNACDNPNEVLVISTWRSKPDWDAYRANPGRIIQEKEFESILDGPAEYLAYNLGLQ